MRGDELTAFLNQEVYPAIQKRAEEAFPELAFRRTRKGNGFEATKGPHGDRLCFYDDRPHAFVIQGADGISLWNYIKERDNLIESKDILEALCKLAGVPLSPARSSPEAVERYQQAKRRESLLEEAQALFMGLLPQAEGRAGMDYLKARGWGDIAIGKAGFGFWPGLVSTRKALEGKGFSKEEVEKAFPRDLFDYKVTFPHRDSIGTITSFWGRITRPIKEGEEVKKYLPFTGEASKETPFLLERLRGLARAVLVEGYFDALTPTFRAGLPGVVATMGASLPASHLEALRKAGIKDFLLALDTDEPGRKGTERAVEALAKVGLPSFIVQIPEGIKDVDEWITKEGPEPFKKALDYPLPGAVWLAQRLSSIADLGKPVEKEAFIRKALSFEGSLPSESTRFGEDFLKEISARTDYTLEALLSEAGTIKEREGRKKLQADCKALLGETGKALEAGSPEEAILALKEGAKALHLQALKEKAPEVVSLSDFLRAKRAKDEAREGLLGYRLPAFPKIEKHTEGIQPGLYIIGAVTNVGKTSLLTNLLLSILEGNQVTRGIYFSLDDNKEIISNRLLAQLSTSKDDSGDWQGLRINQVRKKPGNEWQKARLDEAYQKLFSLVDSGRLRIHDISEIPDFSQVEMMVRENPLNLVVAIDGLYNLPIEGSGGSGAGMREANVERANRLKGLVDTFQIPLIGTAEIRKKSIKPGVKPEAPTLDDLMETGKYGYNANLVWLLHETGEWVKKDGAIGGPEVDLIFAKNKVSDFKGKEKMLLHPALALYEERPADEVPDWTGDGINSIGGTSKKKPAKERKPKQPDFKQQAGGD